ncbi:MAG: SDR family oxidoreductase [Gammaproteobacteria bacterium]|jgi:nucleoside-diphosphate-sugar epimerase
MEDKPDNSVLIAGCGYIGRRLAVVLTAQGYRVTGLVRSQASADRLQAFGVRAISADLDATEQCTGNITGHATVFYLAPPPAQGNEDTRMAAFLRSIDSGPVPRRIVYISTSAVYGDCQGEWITEAHAVKPTTARGYRRLDAENRVQAWSQCRGVEWIILRVPGIYGPGKLPLERLRKGTPVLREADAPYTNRIHADDLVSICVAAMHCGSHDTFFNVSDGNPGNMTDYFFRVADAAGLPRPPTVTRAQAQQLLSPGMLSFLQDSRRMDNRKMLRELGVTLEYTSLDAGLRACFKD